MIRVAQEITATKIFVLKSQAGRNLPLGVPGIGRNNEKLRRARPAIPPEPAVKEPERRHNLNRVARLAPPPFGNSAPYARPIALNRPPCTA